MISRRNRLSTVAKERICELRSVPALDVLFKRFSDLGSVYIFGGAVRDWYRGDQPRDLDICVDAPKLKLLRAAQEFAKTSTAFGGWVLDVPGTPPIDLWPLSHTWIIQSTRSESSVNVLVKTTSYNVDGIAVSLDGTVYEHGFFHGMHRRVLHFNMCMHPYPVFNSVRGLRLAQKYGLSLGEDVRAYAQEQLRNVTWKRIASVQLAKFGSVVLPEKDIQQFLKGSSSQ